MPAVIKNLTPDDILEVDYPMAQTPALGGEKRVFLTATLSRILGFAFMSADGVVEFTFENAPISGPILCVVYDECKSDTAPVITLGDLTGTLEPVQYARNTSFNFGVGRAVELTGPGDVTIYSGTVPTITNAKRGSKFVFVQIPQLSDFTEIGVTRGKDITVPARSSKNIADGMDSSRFNKKGRSAEGRLRVTALDRNGDDGIQRFCGQLCVALLETWKEDKILVAREFCTNYVPGFDETNPEADGESTVSAEGMYQCFARLVAPGTDPSYP